MIERFVGVLVLVACGDSDPGGRDAGAPPTDAVLPGFDVGDVGVTIDPSDGSVAPNDVAANDDAAPTDSAPPDAGPPEETTRTIVTVAAGGTARSADGVFTLHVEPGGVAADTEIAITRVPEAAWPADVRAAEPVGGVYSVEPDGLVFAEDRAWIRFHFANVPAEIVDPGPPARYGALLLLSRGATGMIELEREAGTHHDPGAGTADAVGHVSHLSLKFCAKSHVELAADLHEEDDHLLYMPWLASNVRLQARRSLPIVGTGVLTALDFGVHGQSAVIDAQVRDSSGTPVDAVVFDPQQDEFVPTRVYSVSLPVPSTTEATIDVEVSPPQYSCVAPAADASLAVNASVTYGTASVFVQVGAGTDCSTLARNEVSILSTIDTDRDALSVGVGIDVLPRVQVRSTPATTTRIRLGEYWMDLPPAADAPAAGPPTLTVTRGGTTITATRGTDGTYTTAVDNAAAWMPGGATIVTVGADTRMLAAPTPAPISFGPVAGLDTDVVLTGTAAARPIELTIALPGDLQCNGRWYRGITIGGTPGLVDLGGGAVGLDAPARAALEAAAMHCNVTPDHLTQRGFTLGFGERVGASLDAGGIPLSISTGYMVTVDGGELTAVCTGARNTYCYDRCVDLRTNPAHCGRCGRMGVELCEGTDDDCDGTVDDGCPTGLAWPGAGNVPSPMFGDAMSAGSTTATGQCASSNPLIGFCGSLDAMGRLSSLRVVCSQVRFVPSTTTTPYTYSLAVTELDTGSCTTGATDGGPMGVSSFAARCPDGRVLEGLSGVAPTTGPLGALTGHCVRLGVSEDLTGTWRVVRLDTDTTPTVGSGPGMAFGPWLLPEGSGGSARVLRQIRHRYELNGMDRGVLWVQALGEAPILSQ